MLDINSSVLFVFLLVGLLTLILNKIFYKPIGHIINERESRIEQDSRKLDSITDEIEENTRLIEDKIRQARQDSMRIREELFQKGETLRSQIVTEAREKAKNQLSASLDKLDKEIETAEKKLEQEVEEFSQKIFEIFL